MTITRERNYTKSRGKEKNMIGIYKFTNKINNKIYIGQSKNIETRYKRHLYDAKNGATTVFHAAIRKYGIENFSFEIVKECKIEELDELEKFYISNFNSLIPNGYNMQTGGKITNNEPYYSFKQADIFVIYDLLKNTEKSLEEIGELYNVTGRMIGLINSGIEYCQNDIQYPIRNSEKSKEIQKTEVAKKICGEQSYRATISEETAYDIIYDLTYNLNLTSVQIAEKYKVGIDVVKDINRYKSWKQIIRNKPCRPDFGNRKINEEDVEFITQKLKEPITIQDICKYNDLYTYKIIHRINIGETWHRDNIDYPIRKFIMKKGKLTVEQVFQIYDELKLGTSIKDIANRFNLSLQSVRDIKDFKTYKYLKDFYKF